MLKEKCKFYIIILHVLIFNWKSDKKYRYKNFILSLKLEQFSFLWYYGIFYYLESIIFSLYYIAQDAKN